MKRTATLFCCLLFVALAAGRAQAAPPGRLAADEARIWRLAEKEQIAYENTVALLDAPALVSYVNGVMDKLWDAAGSQLPRMSVRVVENADPEAFAYPNGVCYVSTGMLAVIDNEHQLAVVLGHELAHYVCRHTHAALDRLQMSYGAGQRPRGSRTGKQAWRTFLVEAEQQADRLGLELSARAGYCTGQALDLLTSLDGSQNVPGERHSHLPYKQRFRYIENWLAKNSPGINCPEPDAGDALYNRTTAIAKLASARAAGRRGEWRPALRNIVAYLKLRPDDCEAHFIHGEILRRSKGREALSSATGAYLEAIRLNSDFAPAYRAMGMLHFKAGERGLAGRYFKTYLALAPDSSDKSYVSAYLKQCRQ